MGVTRDEENQILAEMLYHGQKGMKIDQTWARGAAVRIVGERRAGRIADRDLDRFVAATRSLQAGWNAAVRG